MNYSRIYDVIINRAYAANRVRYEKTDERYIYYEKHHIIPRCMGGTDDKTNLVLLLPGEHYVAHQLLVKMHPHNYKLLSALVKMTGKPSRNHSRISNKMYSWIRTRFFQTGMPATHRLNISTALKGRKKSKDHIKNGVESRKNNDRYKHTTLSKSNISVALSVLKWYNNGKDNIRISTLPPPGYTPGRLHHKKKPKAIVDKIYIDKVDETKVIRPGSTHGNSGKNNISWKGYIYTPDGIFESSADAATHYGVTDTTIRNRCRSHNKIFKEWVLK